ncbi:MAG: efflux RND transporter periplasmic adaptor subunit [Candidatus Acidiferrum sp.]
MRPISLVLSRPPKTAVNPAAERSARNTAAAGLWLCLAASGLAGCGKGAGDANAGGPPPSFPVQVRVTPSARIPDATEYLSILKSRRSANINPQVEGQITKIFVKSGDHVTVATPLMQIDPLKQEATVSSQDAARAAQEATVRNAKIQLDREQRLYDAKVVAKQDLDNAQTTYDSAVSQLKSLSDLVSQQNVELHYYKVAAPMDGIVGDIPVRVGDRVMVSTLLTTVDQPGALEAYIYVPADRGRTLHLGLPVDLLDETGAVAAASKITFISPEVDTETQTVLAKATIENAGAKLRIAQQLRARVIWGTHDGPLIPVLAVTRINGQFFAFLAVKEDHGTVARQKLLKVGDTIGNDYAVLDGLKPGDHVIVSGTDFLQDGVPVTEQVQNTSPAPGKTSPGR